MQFHSSLTKSLYVDMNTTDNLKTFYEYVINTLVDEFIVQKFFV